MRTPYDREKRIRLFYKKLSLWSRNDTGSLLGQESELNRSEKIEIEWQMKLELSIIVGTRIRTWVQ